ncbi:MAG TPA: hypothetical protein VIK93_03510 [Limnochordales bacterium]
MARAHHPYPKGRASKVFRNLKGRLGTVAALLVMVALLLTACGQGGQAPATGGAGQSGQAGQGQEQAGSGGASGEPVRGGTLTVGTFSDIITINPLFIDDVPSQEVANLVLASLSSSRTAPSGPTASR